jgi:hypothetical protein
MKYILIKKTNTYFLAVYTLLMLIAEIYVPQEKERALTLPSPVLI